ncbi:hypothetical protein [Flavobacterium sp. FPG59]|jgi:hypothetical protein|uniref:hypothetical protein n=1 Tax=Flavobacterium sp. FPG59 TaxID=1929267 RepID=UPI0015946E66|nr:hypothetical protein [Flavobacterium sp. FPG59]
MKTIKDFIYFDYDKAKSLQSQLSGGLLSEITRASKMKMEVTLNLVLISKLLAVKLE